MGTSVASKGSGPAVAPPARERADRGRRGHGSPIAVALMLMTASAWWIGRSGWFRSGDDISYWMAVLGGSMMAVLLLYPARKHLRFMREWGRVRGWFLMHMACGLLGPWLILVHSTWRIGSLNAGVALWSMVIVVISGLVGRYLYVRVHRGLDGERTSLRELQARAGFIENNARSRLAFAPDVESALLAFEQRVLAAPPGLATALRHVLWLPLQQWHVRLQCSRALERPLAERAVRDPAPRGVLQRRRRHARRLVARYLEAVVRVAQFSAYERVFALWHVAHLPFVVLLGISAVVHVVAVHAY
ncbi:hypothetical protein [Aquabacterium humicola]|uniref:hypothetical protein n=1 Tax=Aquabacterium humicola TaxID=3237377 RepID=UPI002542CAB1|nr:hypothetical protein [Rubrivivax pictus]